MELKTMKQWIEKWSDTVCFILLMVVGFEIAVFMSGLPSNWFVLKF